MSIRDGECEDPNFISVTCDFQEEHICGYESDNTGDFNWIRYRATSVGSGPPYDVILKNYH